MTIMYRAMHIYAAQCASSGKKMMAAVRVRSGRVLFLAWCTTVRAMCRVAFVADQRIMTWSCLLY